MKTKAILLIFVIVFVLTLGKIFLAARLATSGVDLDQIENQSQKLTEDNFLLEESFLELSSLTRIASEAAKLGFSKTEKIVSLTSEAPIALRGE